MNAYRYLKQLSLMIMLVITSAFFASCEQDPDTSDGDGSVQLEVSDDSLYFTTEDEELTLRVKTDGDWYITTDEGFDQIATIDLTEGTGETRITVTVVSGEDSESTFTVNAEGADPVSVNVTRRLSIVRYSIYHETMGAVTQSSPYPFVTQYNEAKAWGMYLDGTSLSDDIEGNPLIPDEVKGIVDTVTYSGNGVNFYKKGYSNINAYSTPSYDNASGVNLAIFSIANSAFIARVQFQDGMDQQELEVNFGICSQDLTVIESEDEDVEDVEIWDTTFDPEVLTLELGIDGASGEEADVIWTEIDYTTTGGTFDENYWSLASSKFKLAAATDHLYIRIKVSETDIIRVDDLALYNDDTAKENAVSVDLSTGEVDPEYVAGDPLEGSVEISIPELCAMKQIYLDDDTGKSNFYVDSEQDRYFEGIIVNDPVGYNYFSNAMILAAVDETGTGTSTDAYSGITIIGSLQSTYANEFVVGDKIRVTLYANKARYTLSNGSFRLIGSTTDEWASFEKLSSGNTINRVELTNEDYNDSYQYEGMPVTFKNIDTPLDTDNEPVADGIWGSKATSTHTVSLFSFANEKKPSELNLPIYVIGGNTSFAEKSYMRINYDGDGVDISGLIAIYYDQITLMPSTSEDVENFTSDDPEFDPRTVSIKELNELFDAMPDPNDTGVTYTYNQLGKEIVVMGVMMNDVDGYNYTPNNYRTWLITENDEKNGVINEPGYGICINTTNGIYCDKYNIKFGEATKVIIPDPILTLSSTGERYITAGVIATATTAEKLERSAAYSIEPLVVDMFEASKMIDYTGLLVQITGTCTSAGNGGTSGGQWASNSTTTSTKTTKIEMINGITVGAYVYKGSAQPLFYTVSAKIGSYYQVTGVMTNVAYIVPRRTTDIVQVYELPELTMSGNSISVSDLVAMCRQNEPGTYYTMLADYYLRDVVRTSDYVAANHIYGHVVFQDRYSKQPNNGFVITNLVLKVTEGSVYDIQLYAGQKVGISATGTIEVIYADAATTYDSTLEDHLTLYLQDDDPILLDPVVLTDLSEETLKSYQHMIVKVEDATVDVTDDTDYHAFYSFTALASTTGSEMRLLPMTNTSGQEVNMHFKGASTFKSLVYNQTATGDAIGILNYSYDLTGETWWSNGFAIMPRDTADVPFLLE